MDSRDQLDGAGCTSASCKLLVALALVGSLVSVCSSGCHPQQVRAASTANPSVAIALVVVVDRGHGLWAVDYPNATRMSKSEER